MIAAIVDTDALLQVIWVSLLAGVGVTAAWGFAIVGVTRSIEHGRNGHLGVAVAYGAVGIAGLATVIGAVVFALVILIAD